MSTKATSDAPKADGEGSQSNKIWTHEETIKVLLLIMHHGNPELGVNGWKAIGEKAQTLFGEKYSMIAVKHQFQRARRNFMGEIPAAWKDGSGSGGDEGADAPTKGKKRAAPSAKPVADTPKAKKPRVAKKIANGNKGPAKDATTDNSEVEERKPVKPMPQRRGAKKSQAKVDDDNEARPMRNRTTHKNVQKKTATEPKSVDNITAVDSMDDGHTATDGQAVVEDHVITDGPADDDPIGDDPVGDDHISLHASDGQVVTP